MRKLLQRAAAIVALAAVLTSCGGAASESPPGAPERAAPLQARSSTAAPSTVMDWAERQFPAYFPSAGKVSGSLGPYTYRFYPATNNFVAVSTGSSDLAVWLYGAVAGWQLRRVASLEDLTCAVLPGNCVFSVSSPSVWMGSSSGETRQETLTVTLPANSSGARWSLAVEGSTPAWLSATTSDPYTIRVTATPGNLASGTYVANLLVTYQPATGSSTAIRVPVSFVVSRSSTPLTPGSSQGSTTTTTSTSACNNGCAPVASPSAVTVQAPEGGTAQADVTVSFPGGASATWSAYVDSYGSPWLTAQKIDARTLRITASAQGRGPGTLSGYVTLTNTQSIWSGSSTLNVNFTIMRGLLVPSAQTVTVDANTPRTAFSGSGQISRADGSTASWSATSSAPWLVVSPASGTTPGALTYTIDPTAIASLPNAADHPATVTVSSPGVPSASFTVTLRKRLPYVAMAMPYGVPAGRTSRVVVGGWGFSQLSNLAASLQVTGASVSNVRAVSDLQLAMDVTPGAAGDVQFRVANAAGLPLAPATLKVAPADPYAASSGTTGSDDGVFTYLHDPVRQAVYGLSVSGNALYKYQYTGGTWTASALAIGTPRSFGLAPDGRLLVTALDGVKTVDPATMTVTGTTAVGDSQQGYGSPLAITADGRLWLAGGFYSSRLMYLDLLDATAKALPTGPVTQASAYIASGDGSVAFVSPDYCCTPRAAWGKYTESTASAVPTLVDLGYDPQLSTDGSRVLTQAGSLYDGSLALLGQLPAAAAGEMRVHLALTPDGSRILALVASSSSSGKSLRIDSFSTSSFVPGTTRFASTGSMTLAQQPGACAYSAYGCWAYGKLLATQDGKSVILVGNKTIQLFKLQ